MKSTPVWRIAFPQVSPSIPTQAEAAPLPVGVGTVKVPVTDVKVPCWNKMRWITIAEQGNATNISLDPGSTSPVRAVLYVGDATLWLLETVDGH